jgi:signal recognition particle receptor subunit beta
MKDRRFEVKNRRKIILVIGLTGQGKSAFINFMTNKEECEVSNKGTSCTKDYKMVDLYDKDTLYYFVDTPGLDDADGDKKNIEEIIKFRNTVPRINAIIFCQSLTEPRFSGSHKNLFKLMKDLYPDPKLFSHLIIVRTKSDRSSKRFEENKNICNNSIYNQLKENSLIGEECEIPEYYIDSFERDNEDISEKTKILDKLEKMDPVFLGINVKILDHIEIYDSLSNTISIKESKEYEYIDFDGSTKIVLEEETENIDLNGIKEVEIERIDMNKSWGACCCKSWMIIYRIFTINLKNEKKEAEDPIEYWQSNRNEDKSEIIKEQKQRKYI